MHGLQPFDPVALAWIAALNPAVIVTGFLMGRSASQWQKLVVAAFVAALAGSALVWLAVFLRILPARGIGGEAGLFVLQFLPGLVWAVVGYTFRPRKT